MGGGKGEDEEEAPALPRNDTVNVFLGYGYLAAAVFFRTAL